MKVVLVTAFPPSKVTLNEYGYHLAKNFVQNKEISELVILADKTQEEKQVDFDCSGTKFKIEDCWEFNSYSTIIKLFRSIKNEAPDAVLINLQFMKFGDKKVPAALGLLLPLLLRVANIPVVSLLHNIMETVDLGKAGFTTNKVMQKIYVGIGNVLTRLVLCSNLTTLTINKYVEILRGKYNAKNVMLVPHGSFETPAKPSQDLPLGPKKIMTFGKFGTYKKVEILIDAVQELRDKGHLDTQLVIAGTDSPNTPGYLKQVAEQNKQNDWIEFTGYVAEEDVEKTFTDSAVVVFPYTSTTGSSGVLHQAGSYARAVVMPDLGDLSLLVKDEGYRGEFFEPSNSKSLAKAIEAIIDNDDYRKEIGQANYEASSALPMSEVTQMYVEQMKRIAKQRNSLPVFKNIKSFFRLSASA